MNYTLTALLILCWNSIATADPIDLGIVAWAETVNAQVPHGTYQYQQLLFTSMNLNMTFDSGMTLGEILADDLGPVNNGTLVYNIPFPGGASGAYSQDGTPTPDNISPGNSFLFTAATSSGTQYPGYNTVGSTASIDPTNVAATYQTILGNAFTAPSVLVCSVTQIITLPPLGTITNGNTVTSYQAEVSDTTWGSEPVGVTSCSQSDATPEPSTLCLAAACVCLVWRRFL